MVAVGHEEIGVVPGRYAGPAVPVYPEPTPQQSASAADRAAAELLASRICAAAAAAARSECQLLQLVGEFDAADAVRWWSGVKSLAHWLSWTCSMSPGAARERVRVARALRRMPAVAAAFAGGRLSYSKVREVTRVVDVVDEARLCELALTATASQLARMIAGFRAADGTGMRQQVRRSVSWRSRDDGMVQVSVRLPAEEGALLVAAITAAKDRFGTPPAKPDPTRAEVAADPVYSTADALLDVARGFLAGVPEDRSGEDRTLVVVHVAADQLSQHRQPQQSVPAGTTSALAGAPPAGPTTTDPLCHVQGVGPVEPETARRFACDSRLIGAVVDAHGEVLALGRTRRLVSMGQRRALLVRDRMCQFPGCAQSQHLQAHHRVAWADGGSTDLDNLILLCRFHHTCVHEGGISIHRRLAGAGGPTAGWDFQMPDGSLHRSWYSAERLPHLLHDQQEKQRQLEAARFVAVTDLDHPDARTIRPGWAGERFDLHACVQALFNLRLPETEAGAGAEAPMAA